MWQTCVCVHDQQATGDRESMFVSLNEPSAQTLVVHIWTPRKEPQPHLDVLIGINTHMVTGIIIKSVIPKMNDYT